MAEKTIEFELLLFDKTGDTGIKSVTALCHGLLFAENLWGKAELLIENKLQYIADEQQDLALYVKPFTITPATGEKIAAAFKVNVSAKQVEILEQFRPLLIAHLQSRLGFKMIRILRDDASAFLSRQIYPLIYQVENRVRSYFLERSIQNQPFAGLERIGMQVAGSDPKSSLAGDVFAACGDPGIMQLDFEALGTLICRPQMRAEQVDSLVQGLLNANLPEDLQQLKGELKRSGILSLQHAIAGKEFPEKWRLLAGMKKKLVLSSLFTKADLALTAQICSEVNTILKEADIDESGLATNEQTMQQYNGETIEPVSGPTFSLRGAQPPAFDLKILGKINLPESKRKWLDDGAEDELFGSFANDRDQFHGEERVISREEMMEQLEKAQKWHRERGMEYVGLKGFVTKWLASNHFAIPPAYSVVNLLKEEGIIEVYDVEVDGYNFPVKAVKMAEHEEYVQ